MSTKSDRPMHPLFPPADADGAPPLVHTITVSRMEGGQLRYAATSYRAEDIDSLERLYELYGGGDYTLWAKDEAKRITRKCQYPLAGASKPLAPDSYSRGGALGAPAPSDPVPSWATGLIAIGPAFLTYLSHQKDLEAQRLAAEQRRDEERRRWEADRLAADQRRDEEREESRRRDAAEERRRWDEQQESRRRDERAAEERMSERQSAARREELAAMQRTADATRALGSADPFAGLKEAKKVIKELTDDEEEKELRQMAMMVLPSFFGGGRSGAPPAQA